MRISDWSSDVCSSDLKRAEKPERRAVGKRNNDVAVYRLRGEGERQKRVSGRGGGDCLERVGRSRTVSRLLFGSRNRPRRELQRSVGLEIGRASCRERVCQYV